MEPWFQMLLPGFIWNSAVNRMMLLFGGILSPFPSLPLMLPSLPFPSLCAVLPSLTITLPSLPLPSCFAPPKPPPLLPLVDISWWYPRAVLLHCFNVPHFVQSCTTPPPFLHKPHNQTTLAPTPLYSQELQKTKLSR